MIFDRRRVNINKKYVLAENFKEYCEFKSNQI